jgi:hypothetical protein
MNPLHLIGPEHRVDELGVYSGHLGESGPAEHSQGGILPNPNATLDVLPGQSFPEQVSNPRSFSL